MKLYVAGANERWVAFAPEVPGIGPTGHEDAPSRDEALARCRALAAEEAEALQRLGATIELAPTDEVVDWTGPVWMIPEWLVPIRPATLRVVIRRMQELVNEVGRYLDGLDSASWDRRSGPEWSVRTVVDHIAVGFDLGLQRLEAWPLDTREARPTAVAELQARLGELVGQTYAVTQFGTNVESRRIRWTPRKVVRIVREIQEAWAAHLEGRGPEPGEPPRGLSVGHDDAPGDDGPVTSREVDALGGRDAEIGRATDDRRLLSLAYRYRYYRHRLTAWPDGQRERLTATFEAYRDRLLTLDETEIALVRLNPAGGATTVRFDLRLGVAHVHGHLAQMRTGLATPTTTV